MKFKTYAARVKATGNDREFKFVISTERPDRDKDVIQAAGWNLDKYKMNPVVLWAHDYHGLPVGRCTGIGVSSDGKLVATAKFATAEMNPMAECVYQMIAEGYLRATSVGFNPTKFSPNELGGMTFAEQELLEFSIVPVPANPEALVQAKAAGIDIRPIIKWAKAILKPGGNRTDPALPGVHRPPQPGGGNPTHPFGLDDEHTGGDYANPAKEEDDEARPPNWPDSPKDEDLDDLDIDEEDSRRKRLLRTVAALLRELEEEEDEEEEESRKRKRREETDRLDDLSDDEDPLSTPHGVRPIGPKAVIAAARCGQSLYNDEGKLVVVGSGVGKRVAVCPKGPECPHKANQAIQNCPAKRDCPLIWDAQHHPGEGQAMPPGWGVGNPRSAINPDGVTMKDEREIAAIVETACLQEIRRGRQKAAQAGLGRGNVGTIFGKH